MKTSERTYRLTGMNRILGAQPANPKVRSEYIASKAASIKKGLEETDRLPENLEDKGLTVFLRDEGALCLCDYVIKGYLKEALLALKSQIGISAPATKVDNYVLITPAYLHFTRAGKPVTQPDQVFERPLRAMTMQGPRVSVPSIKRRKRSSTRLQKRSVLPWATTQASGRRMCLRAWTRDTDGRLRLRWDPSIRWAIILPTP